MLAQHMNPFVNPRKRGISLPKGCKDLIDALHRRERPRADDIPRRLLAEYSKRLKAPGLSPAARAKLRRALREIKEQRKRST